jgi:hypothetical protein
MSQTTIRELMHDAKHANKTAADLTTAAHCSALDVSVLKVFDTVN